jgi:DNA-binding MarR family transcriptional regulator
MSAAGSLAINTHAGENPFSAETMAAFRTRPDFPGHAIAIARSFIDQFVGNRFLNLITNDRGRMQVAHAVLYLHYTRDPNDPTSGLTSSRLKAFCTQHNMCSPGRTAAMLAVMQMSGHVVDAPAVKDRRIRLLMPTQKLLDTFLTRWITYFDALADMMPETADIARAARERDEFIQAYIKFIVEHYRAGRRLMDHVPQLNIFADANAGMLIFLSLFAATGEDGPPSGERVVQMPISELARRFGVSRAHVKQVLRGAQDRGLLRIDDGSTNGVRLMPAYFDAAYQLFAAMFALELHTGLRALNAANGG